MTTGHSDNTHGDHNHITAHADFPSATTHGSIHWDTGNNNFYVYTDNTTYSNGTTWNVDVTTPSTGWIQFDTTVGSGDYNHNYWVPVKCKCCDRDIKEKDDGLSIKMGDKEFWFHRRCFGDKRNSSFIRALIISTDLELLD